MRIGYFGGSFDPPHRGHLAAARAARDAFALDRVLFAPTGFQPLKPGGAVASFAARLAMVKLLCAGEAGFEVSELEAPRDNGQPNFAIDALAGLPAEVGDDAEIFVLVGADAFLQLRQWRAPERLLAAAEWIVLSRPGFSIRNLDSLNLTPEQLTRVHLLSGVDDPASATEIRQRLREGEDCSELLPPQVLRYIQAHHLYGVR